MRYEIDGGGPRKEHWEIPETALKEAIINALAHRDYYDKGARISIEVFPDRVEITNPGGLSNAITEAEFGTKSHSRNPLIFGLFVRINMVEQIGSGIGRIRDLITKAKLPQPQFKTEGMFTVVFSRIKKSSGKSSGKKWTEVIQIIKEKTQLKLNKSSIMILELVYNNPAITIPEMASIIGITQRGIEKNIKKLKGQNLVQRIDGEKGGYWKLIID